MHKTILHSNYDIHLLRSLQEFRFLRLDTEDENTLIEIGKAEADGSAQGTNPGERQIMGSIWLIFEGERNRENTAILSDGGWTGIITVYLILYHSHTSIYNDQWPKLSWVLLVGMGNKGGRHNNISHQLTSGTSLWWLSWPVSLGSPHSQQKSHSCRQWFRAEFNAGALYCLQGRVSFSISSSRILFS